MCNGSRGNDGLLQIILSFCGDGHGIFRPSGNICSDQNSKILVSNRELVGVAYCTAMTKIETMSVNRTP
jgi:hypothetical protein